MIRYLFTRFLHAIFVLWGAFTLSFVLLQVMPGDAVLVKFQDPELGLSPQQIADMRATYGADESAITQYAHVLGRTLHGNLGYSIETGLPVGRCSMLRTQPHSGWPLSALRGLLPLPPYAALWPSCFPATRLGGIWPQQLALFPALPAASPFSGLKLLPYNWFPSTGS